MNTAFYTNEDPYPCHTTLDAKSRGRPGPPIDAFLTLLSERQVAPTKWSKASSADGIGAGGRAPHLAGGAAQAGVACRQPLQRVGRQPLQALGEHRR